MLTVRGFYGYCLYVLNLDAYDEIYDTHYGLADTITAIAKLLKVSALSLRLIVVYEDDIYPDYDVYLDGELVGCIHYYIPC